MFEAGEKSSLEITDAIDDAEIEFSFTLSLEVEIFGLRL